MKALRRGRAKSNASETSITIPGDSQGDLEKTDLGGSVTSVATGSTSLGGSRPNVMDSDVNIKRDERGTSDQPWKSIVRKATVVRSATRR